MAKRWGIGAVLSAALTLVAAASPKGRLDNPGAVKIHIWMVDLAGLPEKVRAQAEETAAAIFRTAGVEVRFVECLAGPERPCLEPPGKADFWLQVLAGRPRNLHQDATGFAVLTHSERPGDSYAAVSYPKVEEVARELDAAPGEVLGVALAHEVGHLLLHSSAHARSGVMSVRLDRRQLRLLERGELQFTQEETVRLSARAESLGR